MTTTTDRLAKIEAKIEQAARDLHPILLADDHAASRRAHDALNALAVARLEVGLLQMNTETTDSKGA